MENIDSISKEWIDRGTPMLTTYDNPYDPFTEFRKWFIFDNLHGYNCCAYIGRMAPSSPLLSDAENNYMVEKAIDDLIENDFLHIYRKVFAKSTEE